MKAARKFKLPVEHTALIIPHYAVKNAGDYMLKLLNFGIQHTDFGELENEDIFEIKLKQNNHLTQSQWNQFLKMIQEDCTDFSFVYSSGTF